MLTEAQIVLLGLVVSNLIALVGGLIKVFTRLTKIETDLKWVIRNCEKCQPTSESRSK